MFISIGVRMLVNVEALNMTESTGNVVRHRTVPYIHRRGKERYVYVIQWVPAISGESIAHALQEHTVNVVLIKGYGDKVCYWCKQKEFIKHFDLRFWIGTSDSIAYSDEEKQLMELIKGKQTYTINDLKSIERKIVKNCLVEDLYGFLVTQGPLKRTSRIYTSYAVPTMDSIKQGAVALDNQFFARHAPTAETFRSVAKSKTKEEIPPVQAPYYGQISSSVYGFTVAVDLDSIGKSSIDGEEIVSGNELKMRKIIALEAIREMLDSRIFGAKLSRITPILDYELSIAIVSKKLKLMVSPPALPVESFIEENIVRAFKAQKDMKIENIDENIKVVVWFKDDKIEVLIKKITEKLAQNKELAEFVAQNVVQIHSLSIRDFVNKIIELADLQFT